MAGAASGPAPTGRRVAVVGGGWAGLAAAVEACRRGHHVTLFEMAPQLGGRARGVDGGGGGGVDGGGDDESGGGGGRLDNGQHILIGAYVETLRLLRTLGIDVDAALLRLPLRLVDPGGAGLSLPAGAPLPAFVRGVWAQRRWSRRDRLALLAAACGWAASGFRCDPALTVSGLTRRLPAVVREQLVDPLCVAALNTPAADASAAVFLRVLKDALFAGPGSADLLLPRVGLSELLPGPAAAWLGSAGASVRLSHRVGRLEPAGSGGWRIDGLEFDRAVLALTPTEAARLTQTIAPDWSGIAAALRYEPIVTVYLRSHGTRLPAPMLALHAGADAPAQFVFDRGQLGGPDGMLAFVISGAAAWVERGRQATSAATLRQAEQTLQAHLRGPLRLVQLLTEKRATFRCTPGLRRAAADIAPGLRAAGDHVDGPYPATLEGAVRSGIAAVRGFG